MYFAFVTFVMLDRTPTSAIWKYNCITKTVKLKKDSKKWRWTFITSLCAGMSAGSLYDFCEIFYEILACWRGSGGDICPFFAETKDYCSVFTAKRVDQSTHLIFVCTHVQRGGDCDGSGLSLLLEKQCKLHHI